MRVPRSVRDARREVDAAIDQLTAANRRRPDGGRDRRRLQARHRARRRGAARSDTAPDRAGRRRRTRRCWPRRISSPRSSSESPSKGLLDGLDDRSRAVVGLRFGAGLPQREIARRMGISQMQVSRILRAALERLAERGGRLMSRRQRAPERDERSALVPRRRRSGTRCTTGGAAGSRPRPARPRRFRRADPRPPPGSGRRMFAA